MIALMAALLVQDAVIVTAPPDIAPSTMAAATAPAPVAAQEPVEALTTAEQIERWLSRPDTAPAGFDLAGPWPEPFDDRRVHGSLSVGVGTGGYSSVGGSLSAPIGEGGRLDLRFNRTEGDRYYGWPGDFGRHDPRFGDVWD